MKSKLKMHINIFGVIRINSIIVNIQKTLHISINQTKKVIGKFKDEISEIPIPKKNIKHENYNDVLLNNKQVYHKLKTIRSQRHQLDSYEINKISLSCFNDKRSLHDNEIDNYAYGHYKI